MTQSLVPTAIDDSELFRDVRIGIFLNKLSKMLMNFLSLCRCGHFAGANSPDGFVGNDHAVVLIIGDLIYKPGSFSFDSESCRSYLGRI